MSVAVAFAAKSTEDRHGSIPTQLADARALAEREGLEVVAEFRDEARSAYRGNRGPGLAQAMAECERLAVEHGASVLIVQHSDRLARGDGARAKHLVEYALWAAQKGVTIRSVQDPQTFASGGLVYAALMGDRNHDDSARKSAAVKDGLRRRRDERKQPVGPVAQGYMVDSTAVDGRLLTRRVIDPATRPIIERIFDSIEAGETFGEVARALNTEGLRTARGKPWKASTLRTLVMNEAYAGAKNYPAIIDPERWARIQAGLRRMDPTAVQRRNGGRPPAEDSYFLRSIGRCAKCGATLYTREQAAGRMYVCANRRTGTGLCDAEPIPAALLEGWVLQHLDVFVGQAEAWIDEQVQQRGAEHDNRIAALERERAMLADLDRQRDRQMTEYRRMVAAGDRLARYALEEVERIDQERDGQERAIAEAEAVVSEWQGPPDVDAALDFYTGLVDLVHGRIKQAQGARELNQALAHVLAGLWARLDGDQLRVEFELRVFDEPATERTWAAQLLARSRPGERLTLADAEDPDVPDRVTENMATLEGRAKPAHSPWSGCSRSPRRSRHTSARAP